MSDYKIGGGYATEPLYLIGGCWDVGFLMMKAGKMETMKINSSNIISVYIDGKLIPPALYYIEDGSIEFIGSLDELFPDQPKDHKFEVTFTYTYR